MSKGYPVYSLPYDFQNINRVAKEKEDQDFLLRNAGNIIIGEFGLRYDPHYRRNTQEHYGLDFRLPEGANVLAVESATVAKLFYHQDYGQVVVLKHDVEGRYLTVYAGLGHVSVKVEEKVTKGQIIALSGGVGFNFRQGLHFESIIGDKLYSFVDDTGQVVRDSIYHWIVKRDFNILSAGKAYGRYNPRYNFAHLPVSLFSDAVNYGESMYSASGGGRPNIYTGNQRDNKYFSGVGDRDERVALYAGSRDENLYNFPDIKEIGRDEIYYDQLTGVINLGGNLIKNALLKSCVVEGVSKKFSETVWQLVNGDHDKTGLEYIATRVDDDGKENPLGRHLRITVESAFAGKETIANSVTIKNYDFIAASKDYFFGMKFIAPEQQKNIISNPNTYVGNRKGASLLKVEELTEGRSLLGWLVEKEGGKSDLQVRIVENNGDLGEIIDVISDGFSAYNINGDLGFDLCALSNGGFSIVWQDLRPEDQEGFSLYLRTFDFEGKALAPELLRKSKHGFGYSNIRVSEVGADNKLVVLYNIESEKTDLYVTEIDERGRKEERVIVAQEGEYLAGSGDVQGGIDDSYVVLYNWYNQQSPADNLRVVRVEFAGDIGKDSEVATADTSLTNYKLLARFGGGYSVTWQEGFLSHTKLYVQEYSATDQVELERFEVAEVEEGLGGVFWQDVKEISGGNRLVIWEYARNLQDKVVYVLHAKMYDHSYNVVRDEFEVNKGEYMSAIGSASLGKDGSFTIYWQEGGGEIKGIVYNNRAVEINANYTYVREKCLQIDYGDRLDDRIFLEDLPVYGREGDNYFRIRPGQKNEIRDFVVGKDKLDLDFLPGINRSKRIDVTSVPGATLLRVYYGGRFVAGVELRNVNPLDITEKDFVRSEYTRLEINHVQSGIGVRGTGIVTNFMVGERVMLPELEVIGQGEDISGQVKANLILSDLSGSFLFEEYIEDLSIKYNDSIGSLELMGNVEAVNRCLRNITFVPNEEVSEALNCVFNVRYGDYVRQETLRINSAEVERGLKLRSYLNNFTVFEGKNVLIPTAFISDSNDLCDDVSLALYSSSQNDLGWANIGISDDCNVFMNITDVSERGNFEFLYRGIGPDLFSEEKSFSLSVIAADNPMSAVPRMSHFPNAFDRFFLIPSVGALLFAAGIYRKHSSKTTDKTLVEQENCKELELPLLRMQNVAEGTEGDIEPSSKSFSSVISSRDVEEEELCV